MFPCCVKGKANTVQEDVDVGHVPELVQSMNLHEKEVGREVDHFHDSMHMKVEQTNGIPCEWQAQGVDSTIHQAAAFPWERDNEELKGMRKEMLAMKEELEKLKKAHESHGAELENTKNSNSFAEKAFSQLPHIGDMLEADGKVIVRADEDMSSPIIHTAKHGAQFKVIEYGKSDEQNRLKVAMHGSTVTGWVSVLDRTLRQPLLRRSSTRVSITKHPATGEQA